jgi:hypothetical protein
MVIRSSLFRGSFGRGVGDEGWRRRRCGRWKFGAAISPIFFGLFKALGVSIALPVCD